MSDSQTPALLDGLTTLEQHVVDAARHGSWAVADTVVPMDELGATDDPDLQVRADLIRELLMGRRGELDPRGLHIRGARMVGALDLDHVTAVTGLSLGGCALPDGITCRHARLREMNLSGSEASALNADGLRLDGDLFLENAIVRGAGEDGAVRLLGAHIGGQLSVNGGEITNTTGPALNADRLRLDGDLFLQNAIVRGAGEDGAVRMGGAQIGGQLSLDGGEITNTTGPALHADDLRTNGSVFVQNVTVRGAGTYGAVRLLGAQFGGLLNLDGDEITNTTGPALAADDLRTNGGVFVRNVSVRGAGKDGAVRLLGAHIGGQTHFTGTRLSNDSGPLLTLAEAQMDGALFLPASVVCPSGSTETTRRRCAYGGRRMVVRGLVFPGIGDVSWRQWLHLLVHHTPEYLPQPYQQLAAVERAAGHDNNARHVLITQQEDLRRRSPEALGGRIGRWRHWLWGWLGRYGYRAHRLVITLAVVLALAGGLGYAAGQVPTRPGHHAAERVRPPAAAAAAPGTLCSTAELIGLGVDRGLPLGATGVRARCDLDTGTSWGQAFTYAMWALQALVWALATLAIAAYTGLVRKPI